MSSLSTTSFFLSISLCIGTERALGRQRVSLGTHSNRYSAVRQSEKLRNTLSSIKHTQAKIMAPPSKMTKYVWMMFTWTTALSGLFVILGFSSWREIRSLAYGTSAEIFEGCKTTAEDWRMLFGGLAWAFAITLLSVSAYVVASLFMLCCAFKSLSRESKIRRF